MKTARGFIAWLSLATLVWAQDSQDIAPIRPQAPVIVRPYLPVTVPPIRLDNSERLHGLVRAGILYLTAQDAISLALENNIDVEIDRYNPLIAQWQLERSQAGGALPGVPSGAAQVGAVASGQGVTGSQASAGVSVPGSSSTAGRTANATISQIGPVTQNLDPIIQESSTFSHTSSPQPDAVQSEVYNLIQSTHVYTASYQQGLLSGGVVSVNYSEHYLNENSPTDVLNPSVAPSLGVSVQYNLLRGFGTAANARTITVSRINVGTSALNFKTQVIGLVSQVLNVYYSLVGDYEDLRAKRAAADTARTFIRDVNRQVEIGTVAPSDTNTAETQLASTAQAVVDSETALRQQELTLKNLISRTGAGDAVIANARIIPLDSIVLPASDDLPPVNQMVQSALANRADLAAAIASEKSAEVNSLGTKNGILPTLQVVGVESQSGLAGTPRTVTIDGFVENSDPRFTGGIGTALSQVFQHDFATDIGGVFFQAPVRNRQAQADYAIDILSLRQTQLGDRKDRNQVEVDIRNTLVALQQARARYESAIQNQTLQQELLEAEQKRFQLGASTPYNVAVQQRDLITAQSSALAARVAYAAARVALDQILGVTLERNNISIGEVERAKFARTSSLPADLPKQP
jgi:outer membrane protein TolC